jgi:hypothetical protein
MYDFLIDRLAREFGKGANPERRRALYAKLHRAVTIHGEVAYKCLRTVAAEAKEKSNPERYFCRAALRRFQESGFMPMLELDK